MAVAAAIAMNGNLVCFVLLTRFRSDDMNMRSACLSSWGPEVSRAGDRRFASRIAPISAIVYYSPYGRDSRNRCIHALGLELEFHLLAGLD